MTECYKLLFDLSLYYTVFGFYMALGTGTQPSAFCFLALAAAVLLDSLLRARGTYEKSIRGLRFLPLLLPLSALFFRPSLLQIFHLLPIWAYLGFSMVSNRVHVNYEEFRSHFSIGLWMLVLIVLGLLFPERYKEALTGTIPYLICMLVCGVSLLRMLREQRPDGLRQGIYMALFILLCTLLTIGRAPQLLGRGIGFVYHNLIAPVILGITLVLAVVVYGISTWLTSLIKGNPEPLQINIQDTAEILELEEQYEMYTADLRWLKIMLIVLGAAAVAFLLYQLLRKLLGEKPGSRTENPWKDRESDRTTAGEMTRRQGLFCPRDPRLAIRWVYAHFLAECRRRGVPVANGTTASELAERSIHAFPGADPEALTKLYLPARYDLSEEVTQEEARHAADLWRSMKHTADPSVTAHKKRNR